jgi:murein DD-endopeptidase MepM/ murein hydrolase activator NlpD
VTKDLDKKSGAAIKEISLNGKKGIADRQGGPLEENSLDAALASSNSDEDDIERHLEKVQFTGEIDYLMVLEKLAGVMPFAKPMKNYYISSGFGSRTDPITRRMAPHHGLDFVGVTREKIISPSAGKVILAGRFSDYGNAVVIDHGFGITTRYGHLSEVKVKEGQRVKQGDVLALQGNTGRSTGPHLHYEVRYKNIPLNPRKFLEAGEALFNDGKNPSYARI